MTEMVTFQQFREKSGRFPYGRKDVSLRENYCFTSGPSTYCVILKGVGRQPNMTKYDGGEGLAKYDVI